MEIKFKKNDLVRMNNAAFMNIFDPNLDEPIDPVSKQTYKVTQCRFAADGTIEYKLRGCYGWWKEKHLVESDSKELKDTEAEWVFNQEEETLVCSNCCYDALLDYRGRSTDSRFCPHCGKRMINSTMPED